MCKLHSRKAPDYLDENFPHAKSNGIPKRYSNQKLKLVSRKTNQGLRALSYIDPSLGNNQPRLVLENSFYIKNKMKCEIFNDKKSLYTKMFFCLN